ncbi:MAG: hypothetical protein ACI95C_001141 [Pseudohongiellaceae bacterium]|jgi:hypothetical protein
MIMMPQFCFTKILQSTITVLLLQCCMLSVTNAAEDDGTGYRKVTTYYQIPGEALDVLGDTIKTEAEELIALLQSDMAFEDYVAGLSSNDYARLLKSFVQNTAEPRFYELVDVEFAHYYDLFVDNASENEFAQMFREYLGELTVDYLTAQPRQDFTEYVLSRTLQLSQEDYSNLYRDYIVTLWRYYVTSATPEELTELLGEDYPDPVASASLAIEDEQYFALLADHITTISEAEFIASYSSYITEMTGGLLLAPSPQLAAVATAPAQDSAADSESAEGAAVAVAEDAASLPVFNNLSTEESVTLIRRHIAAVAKPNFVAFFRQNVIQSTSDYTDPYNPAQLATLLELPGFAALVRQELNIRNARDLRRLDSLTAFADDAFLMGVRADLNFVSNIPYPNMRLLRIAVSHVLDQYNPDSLVTGVKLPSQQFQILYDATIASASLYDESGPVAGPASRQIASAEQDPLAAAAARGGEVKWNFLGCGCEIDSTNVIYGFYPTWEVPTPGSDAQQIDLRYYDRVAYFGLTLNERGDISNDDYWREGGVLNKFIQDAHIRNTYIDLAIYSPAWHLWGDPQINIATANIVDKLSIPLQFGLLTSFASNYLVPIFPTYSETIGKNTMGDGLTLYFDNLEDPQTGAVKNLDMIVRLVSNLSRELAREFSDDIPPINLMLDFQAKNATGVLAQLRPLILGTDANMNQYVSRVLIFLEQDTWDSSQNLIDSVRTVFKEDDSAGVFRKLAPILIPAMNEPSSFTSLTRDLRDLRWTFGNAGGAAIWPIPIENSENSFLIEKSFNTAMVDDGFGFWHEVRSQTRIVYFQARLSLIFTMTGLFLVSMLILIWSIREPIHPIVLWVAKAFGFVTFTLFMLSAIFIDPYINPLRIVFFLLPLLFVITIVPLQSSMPEVKVNTGSNKYVKRTIKMQRSRVLRGLRRKLKQGLRHRNES